MGIFDKIKNFLKNNVNNVSVKTTESITKKAVDIPIAYKNFPVFNGNCLSITEKKAVGYSRCTMDFNHVFNTDVANYISKIQSAGFKKATDVRFDYENTYIIVEPDGANLHLVFHIKD